MYDILACHLLPCTRMELCDRGWSPFICMYIRECGSTFYVGLARTAPPTNTNFRLTFLLTRLQEALYEDLPVQSIKFEVYHHFSGLSFIAEVNFWRPPKTVVSCDLFINIIIIIINFFRRVFSEYTLYHLYH